MWRNIFKIKDRNIETKVAERTAWMIRVFTYVVLSTNPVGMFIWMASNLSDTEQSCFVSGTLILTNNGLKQIDSITTNDFVWTYNVEKNTTELNSVEFVRVWYGSDSVTCTVEHPFFVNRNWKAAKELKGGDSLFAFSGAHLSIDSIY